MIGLNKFSTPSDHWRLEVRVVEVHMTQDEDMITYTPNKPEVVKVWTGNHDAVLRGMSTIEQMFGSDSSDDTAIQTAE